MKILNNNKLVNYEGDLLNNKGLISFEQGNEVEFSKTVAYIVPGFIDQHIHGLMGHDTMDGTILSMQEQSLGLLQEGTTSFFPTTMTANLDTLNGVLQIIKESIKQVKGAEILGVHLEGPFINKDKIGAQNPNNVQHLTVDNLKKLKNLDLIKIVTYAPELDQNYEFTKFLQEHNIIGSVGHSCATCEEVLQAYNNGLRCFTHLHNAMSGYENRNPGVVTAAHILKEAHKELIVDGLHVDKHTLQSTYKNLGPNKLNLITDAMRAKSMEDGIYDLGGLEVEKKGNKATLKGTDTLAGSVLQMNNAVKNMIELSNCSAEEAFKMASYNQTQMFGLKNKGLIKTGYDFDITCLDEEFNVVEVYKKGEKVYDKFSN